MNSSHAPELELSIILRALAGDAPALARLYTTHHPLVLRTARRTLARSRLDEPPSELAAEVWLRLLDHGCRALRAFDPVRGSFRGFLKMVVWQHASAIAVHWLRRRQREAPDAACHLLELPRSSITETLHHRRLLHRMLADVVPGLGALDLVLLEEVIVQQTPVHELAPRLGLEPSTLHSRSARLRARLCDAARRIEPEPLSCAA